MRTFLAAKIPDLIKTNILSFVNMMKRDRNQVKWVNPENIHITIYFFGEVNEKDFLVLSKELLAIKKISSPFKIAIKGISAFPNT